MHVQQLHKVIESERFLEIHDVRIDAFRVSLQRKVHNLNVRISLAGLSLNSSRGPIYLRGEDHHVKWRSLKGGASPGKILRRYDLHRLTKMGLDGPLQQWVGVNEQEFPVLGIIRNRSARMARDSIAFAHTATSDVFLCRPHARDKNFRVFVNAQERTQCAVLEIAGIRT